VAMQAEVDDFAERNKLVRGFSHDDINHICGYERVLGARILTRDCGRSKGYRHSMMRKHAVAHVHPNHGTVLTHSNLRYQQNGQIAKCENEQKRSLHGPSS